MAMDSHDDNRHKILIDTVNNNLKDRNSAASSECSFSSYSFASPDTTRLEGNSSSRRKQSTLSKGITIEEFLGAEDLCQLTAIDKLLMKNKAALAEDQMKKTRPKPSKEVPITANKKDNTKAKKKVICSKVANNKRTNIQTKKSTSNVTTKCNGVVKYNSNQNAKTKCGAAAKETLEKPKKSTQSVPKSEKARTNGIADGNAKARSQKKERPDSCRRGKGERHSFENKNALLKMRTIKKETKSNTKKPLELKRLKTNQGYRTRSGNKEKLRNGKTRIFREAETTTLKPTKKFKRSDRTALRISGPGPTFSKVCSLKRTIKQEPRDDDLGLGAAKKRKINHKSLTSNDGGKCETNNNDLVKRKFFLATLVRAGGVLKTSDDDYDWDDSDSETSADNVSTGFEGGDNSDKNVMDMGTVKIENVTSLKKDATESEKKNVCGVNANKKIPLVADTVVIEDDDDDDVQIVCDKVKNESILLDFFDDSEVECIEAPNEKPVHEKTITHDFGRESCLNNAKSNCPESISLAQSTKLAAAVVPSNAAVTKLDTVKPVINEISRVSTSGNDNPATNCTSNSAALDSEESRSLSDEHNLAKESMFSALGLQSIEKINQKSKDKETKDTKTKESYTGTLKAVIKTDKGCTRMEMKPKECYSLSPECLQSSQKENILSFYSKTIQSENIIQSPGKSSLNTMNSSEFSNDDNNSSMEQLFVDEESDKSSQNEVPLLESIKEADIERDSNRPADTTKDKTKIEPLVVPEKSSSFSIHPDRLCSDVCKYCFGKFGSLDTPCHVAQLKNPERQRKILLCEPNLKIDTCLCDACFRFVDRKANRPPIKRTKGMRRSMDQRTLCAVQNCNQIARHYGKRKWRLKIGKKIANLSFDVTRRGSRMSFGLCSQHYCMVDLYTLCGICKKRLNRNDMYSIRSELNNLNEILKEDGIPTNLVDNMLLCKYCHHCMSLRLKYGNASSMSPSNRQYYQSFRKEVLNIHNVIVSDSDDTNSSEGQKYENGYSSSPERSKLDMRSMESPTKTDQSAKKNHNVGIRDIASLLKPLESDHSNDKNSTRIQLKFGNLNIGKLSNLNIGQNAATQSEPKKHEKANSGDNELPLMADFSFENSEVPKSWERCVSTILFDKATKKLWQDLQKPYGNQSSFIRHLIMLEKYWRSGVLTLTEDADPGAVKYINSVKNRIESLETFPSSSSSSSAKNAQPSSSPMQNHARSSPSPQNHVQSSTPLNREHTSSKQRMQSSSLLPALPVLHAAPTVGRPPTIISISQPPPPPPMIPIPPKPPVSVSLTFSDASMRHSSTPPPLLKLGNVASPFIVRRAPICTVKPSSDISVQMTKSTSVVETSSSMVALSPPVLEKMTTANCAQANQIAVTLKQYKDMMNGSSPGPRTKQLMQVGSASSSGVQLGVSLLKKLTTSGNATRVSPSSTVTVNFPSKQFASPLMKPGPGSNNANSMLIAKLPKALTVTQIGERKPTQKDRLEIRPPPLIASPFLVGEKPSVSVFREIAK